MNQIKRLELAQIHMPTVPLSPAAIALRALRSSWFSFAKISSFLVEKMRAAVFPMTARTLAPAHRRRIFRNWANKRGSLKFPSSQDSQPRRSD